MSDEGTTATDVAAWIGAGGSLFGIAAFIWDVYKWRKRGAEIYVELSSNMLVHRMSDAKTNQTTNVVVTVINRGAVPTTITNLIGEHYTSIWRQLRRKPSSQLWIRPTLDGGQIPHLLPPGEVWRGLVPQQQLEEMLAAGRVRIGLCHSGVEKPSYRWLTIRTSTPKAD